MENGFRIKTMVPADPRTIYEAWLSGAGHAAMTGGAATANAEVGGTFTAWDGYIQGRNLQLKPHWCIIQSWRTTQFAPGDPDSRLEICIHPAAGGSELLLIHTGIPPAQVEGYRSGWVTHYFEPMRRYFAAKKPAMRAAAKPTRKKTAKKKSAKRKSAKKKTAKKKSTRKNVKTKSAGKRRTRRR